MTMKYDSLNTFHVAKQQARDELDQREQALVWRWTQLKDSTVRGALVKDAAIDIVRGSSFGRQVHEMLNGRFSGPLISTLGLAFAATRGGIGKRMLFSGISLALGKLLGGVEPGKSGVLSNIAERIGSVVRSIREDRAAEHDDGTIVPEHEPEGTTVQY